MLTKQPLLTVLPEFAEFMERTPDEELEAALRRRGELVGELRDRKRRRLRVYE